MKPRLCGTVCVYAFSIFSVTANAVPVSGQGTWETTLQGRDLDGNNLTAEAYYDTALDITWLANADINGEMDWFAANTWAGGLNINGFTGGLATVAGRNSALWCPQASQVFSAVLVLVVDHSLALAAATLPG